MSCLGIVEVRTLLLITRLAITTEYSEAPPVAFPEGSSNLIVVQELGLNDHIIWFVGGIWTLFKGKPGHAIRVFVEVRWAVLVFVGGLIQKAFVADLVSAMGLCSNPF